MLVTTETTRARMRRVRQRDTAPELVVRRFLSAAGLRYRVCPTGLPGRPDIANRSRRWAVFVHGCFWHGHSQCALARVPKTNSEFWAKKLKDNIKRDKLKEKALLSLGFRVYTVWQCQLDDRKVLSQLVSCLSYQR
jgi:DNA mismatch endonuclease (patch repair protein)